MPDPLRDLLADFERAYPRRTAEMVARLDEAVELLALALVDLPECHAKRLVERALDALVKRA